MPRKWREALVPVRRSVTVEAHGPHRALLEGVGSLEVDHAAVVLRCTIETHVGHIRGIQTRDSPVYLRQHHMRVARIVRKGRCARHEGLVFAADVVVGPREHPPAAVGGLIAVHAFERAARKPERVNFVDSALRKSEAKDVLA